MRGFWVSLPYATFGVFSKGDVVVDAAPIARWMVGKTLTEIKPWLLKKQAKVIEISVL